MMFLKDYQHCQSRPQYRTQKRPLYSFLSILVTGYLAAPKMPRILLRDLRIKQVLRKVSCKPDPTT